MPFGFAMVTKKGIASGTFASNFRAARTTRSDDGVTAIGSRAPPRVRIYSQGSPEREIFVFVVLNFIVENHSDV